LAAKLHNAGLHHCDLYLCHIFGRVAGEQVELRLIDAGRVAALPCWPFARRWVVKDLAQFWYSTIALKVSDAEREAWLAAYVAARPGVAAGSLRRAVLRKAAWIARHDERLRKRQPGRNVSLGQ
jgi:heptose I phosphotransferase